MRNLLAYPTALRAACLALAVLAVTPAALACTTEAEESAEPSLASRYDFFTNYGNYMPRVHCLSNDQGTPDWPWIVALIALQLIVVAGYMRIMACWIKCYRAEAPADRNRKLMDLAWIFLLCAICGYGMSTLIFVWPAYRLLAIFLGLLAIVTWKFAGNLQPFEISFQAQRLQRELNAKLSEDKEVLEAKNHQLQQAHAELAAAVDELETANKELDQFAYAASHDLKSPLRAISSLSDFIVEDLGNDLPEQVKDDLATMQQRVRRMEGLLDGLLEYSRCRRDVHETEHFNLADLVHDAVAVLDVPPSFDIQIQDEMPFLTSAKPPLEQVIRNLVDNALKHHDRKDGVIRVGARETKDSVEITVSDDGPGIEDCYQQRIFEMFHTLKRRDEVESTGMGLALVQRIISQHGGSITVASQPGQGAAFTFTWPLDSTKALQPNMPSQFATTDMHHTNPTGEFCHV